jgi:hypothetical protein
VCVRGGEEKLEERKKKSVNPKQTTRGWEKKNERLGKKKKN